MKILSNGFLVVGDSITVNGIFYCGIDTDVWPADILPFSGSAKQRYDDAVTDCQKVFLLDRDNAVKYYEYCCSRDIAVRLLYCESFTEGTLYETEACSDGVKNAVFLGYDYAFPSGDYYSSVVNDVIYMNLDFSNRWKPQLNRYGLFPSFESVCSFSEDRKEVSVRANEGSPYPVYEPGYFSIFRVFQVSMDGGWTGCGSLS